MTAALAPIRIADRYTLFEQLGAGGTATVHRARDELSGRTVALKQLGAALAGKRRAMLEALFEREYQTLVRLKHPRIIEVYDYGLTGAGPYYSMELLDGSDLQQLSPLPVEQACRYLRDLASSLALIHAHRLLHRDVTPRNVRLTPDGRCKLIDFGALAGFGAPNELVATPAYSAPEVLRRMSLDQRSDLFALGAVGYFALTGRHAFYAARLEVLEELWLTPPLAPSKHVAGIPAELDSLILSLLSIDPLARPSSAAAVIDRLNVLAGLPPEDELAAESYLSSGRIVGRAKPLGWGRHCISRARTGSGTTILLEGPAGIGRTRVLEELALEAQLRGTLVLKADARATSGSFGLVSTLALQLLDSCPDLARQEGRPHAGLIGHLRPELREKLGETAPTTLSPNPSERLALFQQALHEWFVAVARQRPLLVAADNLSAADESSAAFLAALSGKTHELPLVVLWSLRTGEAIAAPVPVKALAKRSDRLSLSGLGLAGCEEFVRSLFGDVDNAGRVARVLFEHTGGNPRHCTDLARLMVQRKVAKYAAGTWVLPLQLAHEQLPSRMEEIVAAKLADLSADAREVAEALSIYTAPVSIERCLQSSERVQGSQALAALDELVAAEILCIENDHYRFVQSSVGATVLAQLDAERTRELHVRAAEALLSSDSDALDRRLAAGWHLLRGGAERRGADMLAEAARAYLKGGHATESVDQIVTALVAVFDVYERQGRSDYELADLLLTLVPLSYFGTDWRITTRYAMRSAELALQVTGLGLAQKLQPKVGTRLALAVGLGLARARAAKARRQGQAVNLQALIISFAALQPTALGTFCVCIDVASARTIARSFEALELLPRTPFLQLIADWRHAMLCTLIGREREAIEAYDRLRRVLQEPEIAALVGEGRRRSMLGGSGYPRALLAVYCASPEALDRAREIERLGMRLWAVNANQVRGLHHAYRGEVALAQSCREQHELFATEGGTTWQSELFWPAAVLDADVLTADTIATRRTWEQLARQAEDVPTLRPYAAAAHAAYLTLRGEHARAIELYEQVLPDLPVHDAMSWLPTRSYFAQALNLAGQHARAKQLIVETLAHTQPEDTIVAMHFCEARRQLALAEAGLGDRARAGAILEELFEQYGPLNNPLLLGLLHKAKAELALHASDPGEFELQLARMHQYFRSTENPALIAQWERLCEHAAKLGYGRPIAPRAEGTQSLAPISIDQTLATLSAATNRNECALRLTLQRARADHGYLYLCRAGEVELVEASGGARPPEDVETQLVRSVVRLAEEHDEDGATIASLSDAPDASAELMRSDEVRQRDGFQYFVLSTRRRGSRAVIGGVIVEMPSSDMFRIDHGFRAALADALYESLRDGTSQ
ncbi:MAG TPA: protein kinase [Polyangiales bacterium]|nr:protein kinase [Polyangiales bacterium]